VASMAVPYFSTISHKRHGFRKNLFNIKCVYVNILKKVSRNIVFLQIIQLDTDITVYPSSCNEPVTFVRFYRTMIFGGADFRKCSNIKLHEKYYSVSPVAAYGRKD